MGTTLYAKLIGRIAFFTCGNIAHIEFYLQGLLPKILAICTIENAMSFLEVKIYSVKIIFFNFKYFSESWTAWALISPIPASSFSTFELHSSSNRSSSTSFFRRSSYDGWFSAVHDPLSLIFSAAKSLSKQNTFIELLKSALSKDALGNALISSDEVGVFPSSRLLALGISGGLFRGELLFQKVSDGTAPST